jgi:hypothetical protein
MQKFECSYPSKIKNKAGASFVFDPVGDASHRALLDRMLDKFRRETPEASDAELDYIDAERHVAVLVDRSVASVEDNGDRKVVKLAASQCTPSAAAKVQANYESSLPGFKMTEFRPYEGKAIFERLSPEQTTARGFLTAAMGLKPWEAKVEPAKDGGWHCTLDSSIIYTSDKYDSKVQSACLQIGRPGWYFDADAREGTIDIHPGEPPTFLPVHPFPLDGLGSPEQFSRTPFGVLLPKAGGLDYETASVDWKESSFLLIGGEGGSGKSVAINNILAGLVAQKPLLSIIDLSNKATDYYWLRPWVTPGHWGCESVQQSAGVLNLLIEDVEHGERAKVWKENAWQNWYSIPDWAKAKYPRHVVVVDEFSSLVDAAIMVKSIPNPEKVPPAIFEQQYNGQAEYDIKMKALRILRTARAQGYILILASQTVNDRSGLGPTTRDLFGHRMVQGANPSSAILATFHDQHDMPEIPVYIRDGGVSKGVGRAELSGQRGRVYKTYWAGRDGMSDVEVFGRRLVDLLGLPDDVDRGKYLDTLRKHGPDDQIDGAFMNFLTQRIDLPLQKALATDSILRLLKEGWEDSKAEFGGEAPTPAPSGGDDGTGTKLKPKDMGTGAQLMDASELARIMEQG